MDRKAPDAAQMLAAAHRANARGGGGRASAARPAGPGYFSLIARCVFILLLAAGMIYAADNFLLPFLSRTVV